MNTRFNVFFRFLLFLVLFAGVFQPQANVYAFTTLTVSPITWNVIGLDSNNVNVGPNHFPVGVRVCNTGSEDATNVTTTWRWDSNNSYIDIRNGTLDPDINLGTLNAGTCADAYYEVEVDRDSNAYDTTREYHIEVNAGNVTSTISTPTPRELYVEHLVSQNRNAVTDVLLNSVSIPAGGTITLMVGQTYTITLVGFTATQGYEQLESFINIPNTIFQINSVSTTYTAPTPHSNPRLYADACTWENNPNSPNYRSCLGVGKEGGDITVTYQVTILQVPASPLVNPQPLSTLIYDFSGSSYHYNSDYDVSTRYAYIVNASLTKSFSPKTILPGGTSALTFTITNPGSAPITNANFTDTLPGGVTLASNVTTPQCGGAITGSAGGNLITVTGATIAANSTCSITVTVTSSSNGTYNNTTTNLLLGSTDTGSSGSDTLIVSSQPPPPTSCTTRTTMATWTLENYTASTATNNGPFNAASQAANVSTATGSQTAVNGSASGIANTTTFPTGWNAPSTTGNSGNSWGIQGGWLASNPAAPATATTPYFQFQVDASNYGGIGITASYNLRGNWSATGNWYVLFSTDGTTWTSLNSAVWDKSNAWQINAITGTTTSTGNSTVYFRVFAAGAQYSGNPATTNGTIYLDDITITGCAVPTAPNLSKSFSPTTISTGSTSTLTFTLTNPNTTVLSGVSFTDVLPDGLTVTSGTSTACTTGTLTRTSPKTISLSGGTLAANGGTCTINVTVTGAAAGSYTNVTSSVSSTDTGPNTTPSGIGTSSLTVIDPPVIAKAFTANPIFTGNSTVLNFSINNPNISTSLMGVSFTDTLPGGLVVTNPNGISGSCGGGTITATPGSNMISLAGATLTGGETCTFSVNVTGTTTGLKTNSVTVTSTNGGTGNTATADVLVKNPTPAISLLKSVGPSNTGPWTPTLTVTLPGSVFYRFVVENIGDVALSGVDISDPNVNTASCSWVDGNGTALVTPFSLPVADVNDNQLAICVLGPITALDGSNPNTATADDNNPGSPTVSDSSTATYTGVGPNLGLAKTNGVTSVTAGGTTTYTLTVTNSGNLATSGTITIVDVLPTGLSVADGAVTLGGAQAANWSCTAASNVITCTSSTTIEASGGTDTSVFSFIVNVDATASGILINKAQVGGGGDPTNPNPPTSTTTGQCTGTNTPNEGCATDSDTVNVVNLGLAKTNGTTSVTAGGTTTYTLTVTNSGNLAASGTITIVDVLPAGLSVTDGAITEGGANAADWTCTAASNVITCTSSTAIAGSNGTSVFNFTVDVDANASGTLLNAAQVGGGGDPTNPSPPTSTTAGQCTGTNTPNEGCATDSDTVNITNLGLAKTNGVTSVTAGGTTTYSLTVTNSGNASSTGTITIVDVLPVGLSIPNGAVTTGGANGADWTCTAATNVITCTSTTAIAGSGGTSVFNFTVNVDATASGTLLNAAQVGGGGDPTNPNPPTSTTAGQCTATNTPNEGCAVDSDTVNFVNLGLAKTDGVTSVTAGSTTTYSLTVTNSGNIASSGTITVVDAMPSGLLSVPSGSVALGGANAADWNCTAVANIITCTSNVAIAANGSSVFSFTANVSANASNSISNRAQVGGGGDPTNPNPPTDNTAGACLGTDILFEGCANDTDNVNVINLGLAKTNGATTVTAGGTTTYALTVTNSGNTASTGAITIVDVLPTGLSIANGAVTLGGAQAANWSCTAASNVITCTSSTTIEASGGSDTSVFSFIVSVDATASGTVINHAQVGGGGDPTNPNPPTSTTAGQCTGTDTPNEGCSTDSDTVSTPSFTITKNADVFDVDAAGDIITYTVTLNNTGSVPLTGVSVNDPLLASLDCDGVAGAPFTTTGLTIAVNGTLTCTGTYTVTQSDMDTNGGGDSLINNTVTGDTNETGPQTASEIVEIAQTPSHTTIKTETSVGPYAVGDTINYDIVVTNTGNITLTGVSVTDNSATVGACTPVQPSTLAPNATMTCPASHVVTQADMDSGSYVNTATGDSNETSPGTSTVAANFQQNPALSAVKNEVSNGPYSVGETITYGIAVTNAGNITLTGVTLTDNTAVVGTCTPAQPSTLAPNATMTCPASHVVTQADVDTGSYVNTATGDTDQTPPTTSTVTVNFPQAPAHTTVKTETSTGPYGLGDTITYSIVVTNTGNTTLTGVTVTDSSATVGACTPAQPSTLAPNAAMTCPASHVVTATDLTNGSYINTATGDTDQTPPNRTTVTVSLATSFTILKTAGVASVNAAGDVITYTMTLTNTGNVTLTGVSVSDLLLADLDCDGTAGAPFVTTGFTINVNGTLTCTGTYTTTQNDFDTNGGGDGDIDNTVTGDTNETGAQTANESVAIVQTPAHTTVKTETSTGPYIVGNTITYDIVVTNTGNVTLTGVTVTDNSATVGACTPVQPSTLAPNATMTCPASHVVTQADVDNGSYVNTATGDTDQTPPGASAVTVNFPQTPSLNVVKEVSTDNITWNDVSVTVAVGDTVHYRVRLTNTGNITLTNLAVDDGMAACTLVRGTDITGDNDANFEPAEEWAYTCSVTAALGTVNNIATADTTETPQDSDTASYTATAALVADPALSKAGSPSQASVGETVTFTLTVTNAGTAPATNVVVTDPLPAMFDVVTVTSVYQANGNPAGSISVSPAPAPYTVTVNLGTLNDTNTDPNTDVVIITITTTVNSLGNPPINNTASLTTSAQTNIPSNDSDSVTITLRDPSPRSSVANRPATLPATGFAPDVETKLPAQPQDMLYAATEVILEIPSLGVKLPIVGVPKKNGTWDVSWLGQQAGWLEGSAFPSWNGNSVLTSHVYASNGLPGPFVNLNKLKYGDQLIVYAYGQKYIFAVQTNQVVLPNDWTAFQHEEKSWLTLITCKEYDEKTDTYRKRVVVRAVLVKVVWDQ